MIKPSVRELQFQAVKKQIEETLQLEELEFENQVLEEGLSWLRMYTAEDSETYKQLRDSRHFWNWFKNSWRLTDRVFLNRMKNGNFSLNVNLKAEWLRIHKAENLGLFPTQEVLEESFRQMLTKHEHQQLRNKLDQQAEHSRQKFQK